MNPPSMHPAVESLFEYARERVTEQDIIDFSPSDPGYGDYVETWTEIKATGVIPQDLPFEVSEVIALTGWAKADEFKEPDRFRRYRRFTTSVAIILLHCGELDSNFFRPANYIARDLLIDLDRPCQRHLSLLRSVVGPTRDVLAADDEEGYPFFTFARMLLAQIADDWPDAHEAATQLLQDEHAVREKFAWHVQDDRFLLGLSNFNQLHADWLAFARQLKNPMHHPDTERVIDAF